MKQTNTLKRAMVSVLAVMVLVLTAFGAKQVDAASTIVVALSQSGTAKAFQRDPSFQLVKDSSWITIKTQSPSDFTISASANTTGKGRTGYVYLKRQGSVVTTYKVIQEGSAYLSVGPGKGSTSTYGKNSNQSVTTNCNWITLYKPNDYNFRIDYSANTTGKTRTGYVYLKEGTATVTTYKITQSATLKVTLNSNGGSSVSNKTVTYGSTYGSFPTPTREGYNFVGWFTAASGGNQITASSKVTITSNQTLYAHWVEVKSCTVSLEYGGTIKKYTVSSGQQFTFPSAPANPDGKIFEGWILHCDTPSIVGINKPGDKVTIREDCYYYISYEILYEKLGDVKDPDSGKTYSVWMVQHNAKAEARFDQNHSGLVLKILDGKDCYGRPDYCIVNSWQFLDDTFKKGVCNLIVKYNKDHYRTDQWDRSVTGCVDEWCEHNLIYCLATGKTVNWIPLIPWEDYADQAVDVDLDATAQGYLPGSIWNSIKTKFQELKNQW